jgi:hypothetical protein
MKDYYQQQRDAALARLRRRFEAAASYAAIVAPDEVSIRDNLWSHWESPAAFAVKYPAWYQAQWGFVPDETFDWAGIDRYPWSYLQACLGLAGHAVLVQAHATQNDVAAAIRALSPSLDSQRVAASLQSLSNELSTEAALTEAATFLARESDLALIQMRDGNWDSGYVTSIVRERDLPELSRLGVQADIYELGIVDLRGHSAVK